LKEIRELIKEGYNNTHIAEIVGISAAMVSNIKTKRVYRG
jgi:predicted transcriptional regulator